ncbi:unnamed protein product [Adineta steineri]|uniref:Uncharacterized protein n=1 Tax=Adineta steineri TaxID=433720 RepID=A0A819E557_9BILA|nr:unnamed protein product [Adineta steineri]CAF3844338.1 unnamed protein product [Adineta steineri]
MLKLLIEDCGADVNHADDEGRTPLHLAAMRGQRPYIKYLIYHEAKVDALSKLNASVLHFAVHSANPMNAEQILSLVTYIMDQPSAQKKDLLNLCTLDNMTPLVFVASHPAITRASSKGKNAAEQKFKDALIEIFTRNVKDEEQIIIVFDVIARRKHHQEFDHLKCLLEVSSLENQEQLVHVACRHDNASLLEWLLNQPELKKHSISTNQAEYTPLLTATFYNSKNCVKDIIESICKNSQLPLPAVKTKEEGNILHICAKRRVSSPVFDMIIDHLSPGNIPELMEAKDSNDDTPLHLVAQTNTKKESYILEKLIDKMKGSEYSSNTGEKISQILYLLSITNGEGKTAAHVASEQGHVHFLELIWKAISASDRTHRMKGLYMLDDNNRFTCLHIAAKNGGDKRIEVVKYLIEKVGIEIDAIGDRRLTSLHIACEYGHLDAVQYLIENGASTTLRNAQLFNCLEISIQKQHNEIVKYLLQLPNWREMMRNAQPIEATDAYDTPMRKLIRYMPDVALWMIEEKLTRKVGGEGQKVSQEIYDYEFYEDMYTVKEWYKQGLAVGEIPTLMDEGTLWRNQMLYNFVSDGEILRLKFRRLRKFLCCKCWNRRSYMPSRSVRLLTFDQRAHCFCRRLWDYTKKHFFEEKIQDDIKLKILSDDVPDTTAKK